MTWSSGIFARTARVSRAVCATITHLREISNYVATPQEGATAGDRSDMATKNTASKATSLKTASTKTNSSKTAKWASRAVLRTIDAGNSAYCAHCDDLIKFRAKIRAQQVICNVYVKNKWDRVEHFHSECYVEAKEPFGSTPIED
jgi:hypothetical protein